MAIKIGIGIANAIGFGKHKIRNETFETYYLLWDSNDRIKLDDGSVIVANIKTVSSNAPLLLDNGNVMKLDNGDVVVAKL